MTVTSSGPAGTALEPPPRGRPTLRGHIEILRLDHWFKNVFALPGVVLALGTRVDVDAAELVVNLVIGFFALGFVASSNYVINEIKDAPFDLHHRTKHLRPVPSGRVDLRLAYVEWIVVGALGLGLAALVSTPFLLTLAALWLMGCIYNLPPVRTKDLPFLDVLSEAINNPLRLLAGWFLVISSPAPPFLLVVSYWMLGCYLMAVKRFAEHRDMGGTDELERYRKSFAFYTDQRLLVSIMFYGSLAMLCFGAWSLTYRVELVLSFPLVALTMATYLNLGFRPDSPAEHPEKLYRERTLMALVVVSSLVMVALLIVDLPFLDQLLEQGLRGS